MNTSLFTAKNLILMGVSLLILVIGYILLGQGPVDNHLSWSVAPIILVFVYLVLFPYTILSGSKEEEETNTKNKKGV